MKETVTLISGASRGLGFGIAQAILDKGGAVAGFSRTSNDEIERLVNSHSDRCLFLTADLRSEPNFTPLVRRVEQKLGPITGLVNNAGIVDEQLLVRQSFESISNIIDNNLKGMLSLSRAVIRGMMVRNFGRIVNISSIVSVSGYKGTIAYSATKGGIDAATKAMARELGGRNITVNSLAPGYMETELTKHMSEKHLKQIVRRTPLGRPGTIDDVVGPTLFLLSEQAKFISGQRLVVDGGLTA